MAPDDGEVRVMTSPALFVACASGTFRRLLRLLPRSTRDRYGDELAEIYDSILLACFEEGGRRRVLRVLPRLAADVAVTLVVEHTDRWRESRCNPTVVASACLYLSAAVWLLIVAASAGDFPWASRALNLNLAVSLFGALGLPVVAMVLSRIRSHPYRPPVRQAPLFRRATAATASAWLLLVCHVAAHAP